ncbi:uncharacterized protein LOC141619862 [Silene latifolia]|uniref:uncharacterized protein LOC141619862 n=1 Tax=Silene latifolia TaxID=37657 RepID=UPI003D76E295
MASYLPSSSSSTSQSQVSQQEFFAFHNIDRQLFFRLVFQLRRDSSEAMQIMAFWLCLERIHKCPCVKIILTYLDPIIESLVEESLIALRVAESDEYLISDDKYDIPILQNIVGKERSSLRHFHENRVVILVGVRNIIQQVCIKAFQDLIRLVTKYRVLSKHRYHQHVNYNYGKMNIRGDSGSVGQGTAYHSGLKVGNFTVPVENSILFSSLDRGSNSSVDTSSKYINISNDYIPNGTQGNLLNFLTQMQLSENHQSKGATIPPSERTIFLTFSKGYPILELELRDFLCRSFGDIVETLYMQEVGENEQPLYARLVVHDARAMDVVLNGQGKVKFAINGKHVWARKYVRKNPNSPPSSPTKGTK